MNCHELAQKIETLEPSAGPQDVARLCLLVSNLIDNLDALESEEAITEAWREMTLKLQAATDQHAAMTEELEQLAESDPLQFKPEQVWTLVRAIKVQSQVLQLYIGRGDVEV